LILDFHFLVVILEGYPREEEPMGCDLCTYILVAPEKVTDEHIASARKYIHRTRKTLDEILFLLRDQGLDSVSDLEKGVIPEDIQVLFDNYFGAGDPAEIGTVIADLNDEKLNEIINFLKDPETRDSNSRLAKIGGTTFRIIVAGDQTWGDTPDGIGYEMCHTLLKLGLDRCFDIQ
jgi:hypothetical protein